MDKRTLLAVVLAIFVMFSYSFLMQKLYPTAKDSQTVSTVSSAPATVSSAQTTVSSAQPTVSSVQQTVSSENVAKLSDSTLRKISSNNVDYEFSDIGGCLKAIKINKYNGLEQKNQEIIYDAELSKNAIFSLSGFGKTHDLLNTLYKYLKIENGIEFSLLLKNELEIKKTYTVVGDNGLVLELKVTNVSTAPINGKYSIVGTSDIKAYSQQDARFIEGFVSLNGKRTKARFPNPRNMNDIVYYGNADWVSLQNKYFSIVCKNYQKTVSITVSFLQKTVSSTVSFLQPTVSSTVSSNLTTVSSTVSSEQFTSYNPNVFIMLENDTVPLNIGESKIYKYFLYSGPTNTDLMASYNEGIEKSINLGTFGEISRLFLYLLKFFYKVSHNYGIAIMLLAILIAIVLYPLTLKSFRSMKEMQVLQPKIERIRRELKDNPQKLNKEIMELYKKHKVNPFGGCLPMLLQMPVFIALYQAFSRAIELKNARFLWIQDLSAPDRAFTFHNFTVNILPILMAVTMFFQQKLTATSTSTSTDKDDPVQQQQKMMLVLMPVMFGFIFYNMSSGLVLYWFLNTLIMFFQQTRIMRNFHVERHAAVV